MFKNALISVSDKTGLDDLCALLKSSGTRVVSTGGTAKALRAAGLKVTDVSEWTGFPEVMDGRVKTLHPRIHMALLARGESAEDRAVLQQNNLEVFDLVVVNLYPFEDEPGIETIDIGGPTLIRASAKSHDRIVILCDPADYHLAAKTPKEIGIEARRHLAAKAFRHVSSYDAMIADWFSDDFQGTYHSWGGRYVSDLRYGENPHQEAAWFQSRGAKNGIHKAEILHGKALSYNNLNDIHATVKTLRSLGSGVGGVAVKHANPCGAAVGQKVSDVVERTLRADPKSVFGGIVGINEKVDATSASLLKEIFLECVVAPDFAPDALQILKSKKDLRILKWPQLMEATQALETRSIDGGVLIQQTDIVPSSWASQWKVCGTSPSTEVKNDLLLAWQVCANLKSNAIAIAGRQQTLGLGMGQVNRVDAVKQAIERWREYHPTVKDAVLASDAFFPFADSIEMIASAGIKWVIQPGGSIRDAEVLERAQQLGVNIILTGERHFSH
jgi:phosphoribosylaminoimidazolecarboxamide formyltransferase / IMP cyclohydrolase